MLSRKRNRGLLHRTATTGVTLLLDMSGSMDIRRDETIREVNRYLDKLRTDGQRYKLTVVTFNDSVDTLATRENIKDVGQLEYSEYRPEGWTRLFDAVGQTLDDLIYPDERNLFVVVTDGQENRSRRYSLAQVQDRIQQKRSEDFQFVFLGSGPDSWTTGQQLGFNFSVATDYSHPFNTENIYRSLYNTTKSYSAGGSINTSMLSTNSTQAQATTDATTMGPGINPKP